MRHSSNVSTRLPTRAALFGAGLLMLAGWAGMTSTAQAQANGCPGAPGTASVYAFDGLPTSRGDIKPSVHRSLSILGMVASRNNCTITVTCVAKNTSSNGIKARDRQCTAARFAVVRYETRTTVRSRISSEIELIKLDGAQGGFNSGSVYVTLTAK